MQRKRVPIFKNFGHRRSWLLFSQFLIIIALILTAFTDPKESLFFTALFITILAFFSATQDILIDAFRIESAPQSLQGPLSSMYIAGYRVAMLVAGAGSLWLASFFGTEIYDQKKKVNAKIMVDGSIKYQQSEGSIHKVAAKIIGAESCNGWTFWHYKSGNSLKPIDDLRQRLRPTN